MDDDKDIDINALIADWEALQIRATGIVRRLEAAEARRASRPDATPSNPVACGIAVNGMRRGDRARIKNQIIKLLATWPSERKWTKEEARRAIVAKITSSQQVHFVTDNGIRTWRASNNLERIQPSDTQYAGHSTP